MGCKYRKNKAVSETVAVILLIAIAVAVSIPVLIVFNSSPPEEPIAIMMTLEYDTSTNKLTITHTGGEGITNAYDPGPPPTWKNMKVIVSGKNPTIDSITGDITFASGSIIKVTYSGDVPTKGDSIIVTYVPGGQLLKELTVT